MNEPCRLCGSEPTLANYYDFYRFHCPTPGCKEHMGDWKVYSGKGKWYGSIDEARDAWNKRQKRRETPSAPETAEPEQMPAEVDNEPQDGSGKAKKQLRAEAVERLKESRYHTHVDYVRAMLGWGHEPHFEDSRDALIDLLTDDEPQDGSECDTREKLERDIKAEYYMLADEELEPIFGWLERQAAITEREVLCQPDERDEQIAELAAELKNARVEWESERDYANQCEARAKELAAERDRLKDVVRKQADSFAKMERELHDAKVEAMHSRDGVESLTEKCHAQREELARFNAEKRGKRRLPKHVAWPRHDDGKLVKLNGLDAKDIVFTRDSCLVRYNDGTDEFFAMDELRRRWKEPR